MLHRANIVGLIAGLMLVACDPTAADSEANFEVGGVHDPIIRMAATLTGVDTVTFSLTNTTGYGFSAGLVTLSPTFTVGQSPSAALKNFTDTASGNAVGDAQRFATNLGLVVGTSAFMVPQVDHNKTVTVTLTVPTGAKLSYVARVNGALDDFVALNDFVVSGSAPGAQTVKLVGYDPNDGSGKIVAGNGTVGQTTSTTLVINNTSDCPAGATTVAQTLLVDDFSTGTNDRTWPKNVGYDGDFNAEWITDGFAARPLNPTWASANPSAPPLPLITGFVKFFDVCPQKNSTLNVAADVVTDNYTDAASDTTLVVYYFDRTNTLIKVDTSHPLLRNNMRRTALYDDVIPSNTRRIAVAPMAKLAATETQTVYYDWLKVDYEPANYVATRVVATDSFSSTVTNSFGKKQPTGWSDYGGDWFVNGTTNFITLWNTAWGSGTARPPFEAGLFKTFSLGTFTAKSVLTARVFAANTFSADDSFTLLRAQFLKSDGTVISVVDSDRLAGRAYGNLDLRRVAIPANATSVKLILVTVLANGETSSMLADDVSVNVQTLP